MHSIATVQDIIAAKFTHTSLSFIIVSVHAKIFLVMDDDLSFCSVFQVLSFYLCMQKCSTEQSATEMLYLHRECFLFYTILNATISIKHGGSLLFYSLSICLATTD